MTAYRTFFPDINDNNLSQSYIVTWNEENYKLQVRWSNECNCAFLSILSMDNMPIILNRALVNSLKIRTHNLPYIFYFVHINDETYEPTIDTIGTEFALQWDDEVEP